MEKQIYVCCGGKCADKGSNRILDFLLRKKEQGEVEGEVLSTRCLDNCEQGVNVGIDSTYVIHQVTEENVLAKIKDESGYELWHRDPNKIDVDELFDEL